jgi:hypothetical protein
MNRPACIDSFLLQVERFHFILQFSHRCARFLCVKTEKTEGSECHICKAVYEKHTFLQRLMLWYICVH